MAKIDPFELKTGQTEGYVDAFPQIEEPKEKYGVGKTAAAYIAYNNPIHNYGWKAADMALTAYEYLTYDGIKDYDPLSDEERSKYDPKYWPIIGDAKSPWQAGRKVLKAQEEEHYKEIMDNGSLLGSILGGVYVAPISPSTYIPIMKAAQAPTFLGRFAKGFATGFPQIMAGTAVEEAGLYYAQETRTIEESAQNTVSSAIFGSLMFGSGTAIFGGKGFKNVIDETVKGAEVKTLVNKKGEIVGFDIQDGGTVGAGKSKEVLFSEEEGKSLSAALTNPQSLPYKPTIEDLTLVGAQYKLHPSHPVFWFGAHFLRNPVIRGLYVSDSLTTRTFTNDALEHNLELLGHKKNIDREASLQTKIAQYKERGTIYQLDLASFYYKQCGLDDNGNQIKNAFASAFKGHLNYKDFNLKTSIAITEGGIDADYPVVSEAAKYTIDKIIKPNSEQLEKLNILPPNLSPLGATQYLQRVYDTPNILATYDDKIEKLIGLYSGWNDKIISSKAKEESLHIKLGQLETKKGVEKTNIYDKQIEKARKAIRIEQRNIRDRTIKGEFEPGMLVGDRGMSWDEIQLIKTNSKPIKKLKTEIRHAEEELNVYKREVNKERKPFEKNVPADEHEIKLSAHIDELKKKLKTIRDDLSTKVETGELPQNIFFKTNNGQYRLRKPNYGSQQFRKILDAEELDLSARKTLDNILNMSPDQIAESFNGMMKSGSLGSIESVMNPRVLPAPDKWLYENGFLNSDLRATIPSFLTRMGRLIETETYFRNKGYVPGKNTKTEFLSEGIHADYRDKFSEVKSRLDKKIAKNPDKADKYKKQAAKERFKLDKMRKDDIELIEKVLQRVSGNVPLQNGKIIKLFRGLNNYAYASQLGLMALSCFGDAGAGMFRLGVTSYVRDLAVPMLRGIVQRKNSRRLRESVRDLGIGIELENALTSLRFQNGIEGELPMGKVERATKNLATAEGIINLSNPWTDMWSRVTGVAIQSNMYRRIKKFSEGKLKGNQLKQLELLGLNDLDLCKSIVREFESPNVGEKLNGAYLPNQHLWNDAKASERFEMAIKQELRSVIFSGKDIASYPIELDFHGIANSFLMYMGWGFNAYSNYFAPLFQRVNKDKISGIVAIIALNLMSDPFRKVAKGEDLTDEDWDPINMGIKAIFNSGVTGTLGDLAMRTNAAFDIFPELNTSKVSDKGKLELISGAPYSFINFLGTGAGQLFSGEWNKKDLKTMKRQFPLVDSIGFKKMTNEYIDSVDLPETRYQAHKEKLRERGEVPEKKPRKKKKGRE